MYFDLVEIQEDVFYYFERLCIPPLAHWHVTRYSDMIPDILTRLHILATELKFQVDPDPPTRILLVKNGTECMVTCTIMLTDNQVRDLVGRHGFFHLIPENHHPIQIIHYLQHAKHIITQVGSISFTNALFFNKDAIVYDIMGQYGFESLFPHYHLVSRSDLQTDNWLKSLGVSG